MPRRRLALTLTVPLLALGTFLAPAATADGPLSLPAPPGHLLPFGGPHTSSLPVPPLLSGPLPTAPSTGPADGSGPSDGSGPAEGPAAADTRLTVTVADSGDPASDGTVELTCGPAGGTHPRARDACALLDEADAAGEDLFRPTPEGTLCTQVHGGDATARIVGSRHGKRVDVYANRVNGCEIARWNALRPLLPEAA
ncbi:SSI family serine proteinase inhibitor [uncultured Streptomyces sp.]|uniref:SSI family serine proteinase inhibitor n=1 Tax=uncultured Streptomyces sp. TaxID=174707 RepID=UPI00261BCFA1|nr:SSI family serine proteinase inhibitor [uncultured Streptomyces sp.]